MKHSVLESSGWLLTMTSFQSVVATNDALFFCCDWEIIKLTRISTNRILRASSNCFLNHQFLLESSKTTNKDHFDRKLISQLQHIRYFWQLFWTKICIDCYQLLSCYFKRNFSLSLLSVQIFTIVITVQPCGYLIGIFNCLSWCGMLLLVIGGTNDIQVMIQITYFHRNTKLCASANYKIPRFLSFNQLENEKWNSFQANTNHLEYKSFIRI